MFSFLIIIMPASAEINLKAVSPDEPVDYTYNERFSTKNALNRLGQIRSALYSFREFTEASEKKMPKEILRKVGNTSWERQNLGFMNWPGAIEGTLYKNEYIIKKLQYELLVEKTKSGQLKAPDLANAKKELRQSEQNFQKFWNSFGVGE